jgi:hypothetical protein
MQLYLNNLLTRLRQFSATLDRKEIFIESPWVIIDENQNQKKYIFKRNGDLIISINGEVIDGKWEYLSAAKSLCINTGNKKLLLNQDFIDPTVMVLKKDGLKGENLILANENLLPDLDVVKYLKKLFYQKNSVATAKLNDGKILELHYYDGYINNNIVTIETEPIEDCSVETLDLKTRYVITSGKISKVFVKRDYETKQGKITIEVQQHSDPKKGDLVLMNNTLAPDGKYKIGFFNTITVANGRII